MKMQNFIIIQMNKKYKITGIGNVLLKSIESVEILKINKDLDYVRKNKI